MKRALAIITAVIIALTFSGCDGFFASPDEVISPPELAGTLKGLDIALESAIGEKYVFAYPSSGDYRTSCIQKDFDGDGIDEVLVFYIPESDQMLHLNLFVKEQGQWQSVSNINLKSASVGTVEFEDMLGDTAVEIVVGSNLYSASDLKTKQITVYQYSTDGLQAKFQENCTDYRLCDLLRNGYKQIMLFNVSNVTVSAQSDDTSTQSRVAVARLVSLSDKSQSVLYCGETAINPATVSVARTISGTVDNLPALYCDLNLGNGQLTTATLLFDSQNMKLTNPLYDAQTGKSGIAVRSIAIYCRDINGDGTVDVPVTHELQSDKNSSVLVSWMDLVDGNMTLCETGFYNPNYSYYFSVPEKWASNVKPQTVTDVAKQTFVDTDNIEICTVSVSGVNETASEINANLVYTNSDYNFYMTVSKNIPNDYLMDIETIKNTFRVLS